MQIPFVSIYGQFARMRRAIGVFFGVGSQQSRKVVQRSRHLREAEAVELPLFQLVIKAQVWLCGAPFAGGSSLGLKGMAYRKQLVAEHSGGYRQLV